MTAPLRLRRDTLHRADETWRVWRTGVAAPSVDLIVRWSVERSNGGSVHIGFDSEHGWAQWVRYLGLHIDTTVMANSYWAGGEIEGHRFYATCPHQSSDGAAA